MNSDNKYKDGQVSRKDLHRKNKNKSRKIRQEYSKLSYNNLEDALHDLDEWQDLDDEGFEKFKNGKH